MKISGPSCAATSASIGLQAAKPNHISCLSYCLTGSPPEQPEQVRTNNDSGSDGMKAADPSMLLNRLVGLVYDDRSPSLPCLHVDWGR